MSATVCIRTSALTPQADGRFTVRTVAGFILSVQPDGSLQTRPDDKAGPWETGVRNGNKWIVSDPAYPTGSYAILVVD